MYERGRLNLYKKGRIGAADLHLNLNRDQKAILHTVGGKAGNVIFSLFCAGCFVNKTVSRRSDI